MLVVGFIWSLIAERPSLFWDRTPDLARAGAELGAGIAFGVCIALLSRLATRLGLFRAVSRDFKELLGPLTWSDAAGLAAMSAVAEELLFRGAMQASLGVVPAAIVFGLVHWPVKPNWWPWTLIAMTLGLLFGFVADHTGTLLAPMAAHFTINFLNLKALADGPELPPENGLP